MAKKQTLTTKGLRPPKKHLTKTHAKIYWPYIPLILLIIGGLFLNIWQPLQKNNPATLAYATEMSRSGLLAGTNSQRNANGQSTLVLNDKLNSSAQAKAEDMANRDYWSHNTPDGEEPWVFIDAQGYSYIKAGENLAYGFSDSNATIIGWMNSPSHKANLLDSAFSEVGFGYVNAPNFVGTGNETIVVAHYAKPVVAAAVSQTQPQNSAPKPVVKSESKPQSEQQQAPVPVEEPVKKPEFIPVDKSLVNLPVNTDNIVPVVGTSQRITLSQQLTGGRIPGIAAIISISALALALVWLFKHYRNVRKIFMEGEYFVAHHPIFDVIVVSVIAVAVYLSQSSGVVI
jgi:hypothetical protein